MKLRRLSILTLLTATCALGSVGVAPAAASPLWNLDIHHDQTNYPPGATAELSFDVRNVGDTASSGTGTLHVDLPTGLTLQSFRLDVGTFNGTATNWACPGSSGAASFDCTETSAIPVGADARNLILTVAVAPNAAPDLTASATMSGGGPPEAPPAANCPPGVGACAGEAIHVSPIPAAFGILGDTWVADFFKSDEVTPERQAGSHPDLATFSFDLNSIEGGKTQAGDPQMIPAASLRDSQVDLPPGFIGNPSAVGDCTPVELGAESCPKTSQVGKADATIQAGSGATSRFDFTRPVFNMAHPRGSVAEVGFTLAGKAIHIRASLDPANNYSIRAVSSDLNETDRVMNTRVTIWGVPGDSSHDAERGGQFGIPVKPFVTVPFDCGVDNAMRLSHYDSWQSSGVFGPDLFYELPGRFTGCEKPRFEPSVSLEPTARQANSPTGLEIGIHIPQNENPNGLSTPPVKNVVTTLPEGMALSPSFADGLASCTEAQIGLGNNEAVACPDNSRIAEVTVESPLLPKALEGSLYLAKQKDNPFGSLIAFYLAVHDEEERGILVKIPGRVELDQQTGQIKAFFEGLPQFPFEDLSVKFRSGSRAPLTNPPTCGPHELSMTMTTYSQPDKEVTVSNTYQVNEGPDGTPCQNIASLRPFAPILAGGTLNPVAGAFSPLSVRVSRTDADQELGFAEGFAPLGLTASIKGVGRCSEAQIAAARARDGEGEGAAELASPSCPANSQVGSVDIGVGAGPASGLIYVPGKIYLAGPFQGAPLSGLVIVPGVAGPVDIGNVVVRAPAYIDPVTAQIKVATEKLPRIIHGVLVRVRDVRVHLDRPNFALNPTGCGQKSLDVNLRSLEGATKLDSNRFQVGDCDALGFKPHLSLTLKGGTKRGGHPGLRALYRPRPGDAKVKSLVVRLPRSAFLDQAHIRTICTRVQFAAQSCPPGAQYGFVKAWTPLLDNPLEGPVYLRSSNHKLPDLVFDLHGEVPFQVSVRIDSAHGGIRATLDSAPDVPLSKVDLRMQGGKKGLIVNSRSLCAQPSYAEAGFGAHNGKSDDLKPLMRADCGKGRHGGHGKQRR